MGKPYASICKTCLYGYWILFCLWLPFVYNSIYYDFLRGKLNFVWKDDFGINLMNLRVWKLGCAWYKLCHLNVTFWITFLRCLIWLLSLIIKLWKHNDDTGYFRRKLYRKLSMGNLRPKKFVWNEPWEICDQNNSSKMSHGKFATKHISMKFSVGNFSQIVFDGKINPWIFIF